MPLDPLKSKQGLKFSRAWETCVSWGHTWTSPLGHLPDSRDSAMGLVFHPVLHGVVGQVWHVWCAHWLWGQWHRVAPLVKQAVRGDPNHGARPKACACVVVSISLWYKEKLGVKGLAPLLGLTPPQFHALFPLSHFTTWSLTQ